MIDGSEIRKRELAFELKSSRVFEKCSKSSHIKFCKQNTARLIVLRKN